MIYVDSLRDWGWKYGPSCHLGTDDHSPAGIQALHDFAARIDCQRRWFQNRPRFPHYDLTGRLRVAAIALGAIEISGHDMVRQCTAPRQKQGEAAS